MSPWQSCAPGSRTYPELSLELRQKLESVPASRDRSIEYRPCRVTLGSGQVVENVYILSAQAYIDVWGVWPEDDSGKRRVDVAAVVHIEESRHRLPPAMANRIYRSGESGMGYTVFTLVFADSTRQSYLSGGAVDFVSYPAGQCPATVVDIELHAGRHDAAAVPGSDYAWCLYGTGRSEHSSKTWAG